MNPELLETLRQLRIDIDTISDEVTRSSVVLLLNLIEVLAAENQA